VNDIDFGISYSSLGSHSNCVTSKMRQPNVIIQW